MDTANPLTTIAEAARLLRMQKSDVRKLVDAGELPHIRLPASPDPLFDEADLRAYIARHRVPPLEPLTRPDSLGLSIRREVETAG